MNIFAGLTVSFQTDSGCSWSIKTPSSAKGERGYWYFEAWMASSFDLPCILVQLSEHPRMRYELLAKVYCAVHNRYIAQMIFPDSALVGSHAWTKRIALQSLWNCLCTGGASIIKTSSLYICFSKFLISLNKSLCNAFSCSAEQIVSLCVLPSVTNESTSKMTQIIKI